MKPFPFCRHNGNRDCFACDPVTCKCTLLANTDFISGACPFYKTDKEVKDAIKKLQSQRFRKGISKISKKS